MSVTRSKAFAVVVAVLATAALCYAYRSSEWRAWNDEVKRVTALSDSLQSQKDSLAILAARERERADSIAAAAEVDRTRNRERADSILAEVVPEACERYTAPRDSLIGDLISECDQFRDAFEQGQDAMARLNAALAIVQEDRDNLRAVLDDRPAPPPIWAPKLSVGCLAGVDVVNRGALGVTCGAGLTWEIPIF